MQLSLDELRGITTRLFDHMEESGHSVIEIPYDYYWVILEPSIYDVYHEPSSHGIGQLTDDWSDLQAMMRGDGNVRKML